MAEPLHLSGIYSLRSTKQASNNPVSVSGGVAFNNPVLSGSGTGSGRISKTGVRYTPTHDARTLMIDFICLCVQTLLKIDIGYKILNISARSTIYTFIMRVLFVLLK